MICTVTLNASVDKAYKIDGQVNPGCVMRVVKAENFAGGKGLNCARAISTCGKDVLATGFVGGHNGKLFLDLLDQDGVEHDFVNVGTETRCCINVIDSCGASTEFLEPGAQVTDEELKMFQVKLDTLLDKADLITFNGSLPAGLSSSAYATLIKKVNDAGKLSILDTSGQRLIEGIEALPTMIKPNIDEMQQILGRNISEDSLDEILAGAEDIYRRGIKYVVVSLGANGSVMVCDEGVFRGVINQPVKVINTVGAGDTMVGAFAVGMVRKDRPADILKYAMSCATANCMSPETGHFNKQDADLVYPTISITKLK